jgi:hypothetical protein
MGSADLGVVTQRFGLFVHDAELLMAWNGRHPGERRVSTAGKP